MFNKARDYTLDDIYATAARHAAIDGWMLSSYLSYVKSWQAKDNPVHQADFPTASAYADWHMNMNGYTTSQLERCRNVYNEMQKFLDAAKSNGITLKLR